MNRSFVILFDSVLVALAFGQSGGEMNGTWKLDNDASTRITFNRDGTFLFSAPAYKSSSSGRFELRDGSVYLYYIEVDGEPIKAVAPLKAPMGPDASWFTINRFRYVRAEK